jgi:trimethylamine corrinoid protein
MTEEYSKLYESAGFSIVEGDEDLAFEVVEEAKEKGVDLMDLLLYGFGKGNEVLAEEYDKGKISIAELIYGTEIMKNVTDSVFDYLNQGREEGPVDTGKPRVLLATVAGDIHDIGKGIVADYLRSAGFEVIDLGCEIPVEAIAGAAKEFNVDIIGTSALLTTTLPEQRKLEKYLRDLGERESYMTMVG